MSEVEGSQDQRAAYPVVAILAFWWRGCSRGGGSLETGSGYKITEQTIEWLILAEERIPRERLKRKPHKPGNQGAELQRKARPRGFARGPAARLSTVAGCGT